MECELAKAFISKHYIQKVDFKTSWEYT